MQIFVTSKCPRECAQALDDLRLNAMMRECAQILSAAIHLRLQSRKTNVSTEGLYKPTHLSHPCVIWAGKDRVNFEWLLDHGYWLEVEYQSRFDKIHASAAVVKKAHDFVTLIPKISFHKSPIDFANVSFYKDMHVVYAYRKTLREKWMTDSRTPRWTNRGQPYWRDPDAVRPQYPD